MNEFGGVDIHIPAKFREYFQMYCQTGHEGRSDKKPEDSPFPRMIDMWFLALCIAIHEGIEPDFDASARPDELYKPMSGDALGTDPWRSDALMLIALVEKKPHFDVVTKPHEMIRVANAYACAGLPSLIHKLNEERQGDTALNVLSDYVEEIINSNVG